MIQITRSKSVPIRIDGAGGGQQVIEYLACRLLYHVPAYEVHYAALGAEIAEIASNTEVVGTVAQILTLAVPELLVMNARSRKPATRRWAGRLWPAVNEI